MITFDEAVALVQAQYPEFDQWIEYGNAWVLGVSGPASFGGSRSPVAILKETGELITYPTFVAEYSGQQVLAEGELKSDTNP